MVGLNITRKCPYCNSETDFSVSYMNVNNATGEPLYSNLKCSQCKKNIGDEEKIKETQKQLIKVIL